MKQSHFARKCRQLKHLADQIQKETSNGQNSQTPKLTRLLTKIKRLWAELRRVFSGMYLKRLLGPAAAITGITLGQHVSAQTFAPYVVNPFTMDIAVGFDIQPAFADFDGDGDLDVIWGGIEGNFHYFENTGTVTEPQFAPGVQNPFGLEALDEIDLNLPIAVDLDNDGDFDLIVTAYYGNLYYYENTGTATNPVFASPVENPFGLEFGTDNFAFPAIADLDGDGDFDILAVGYYTPLSYFENIGTPESPAFSGPIANPFNYVGVAELPFIMLGDLDMDGDIDLMEREYDGIFHFHENVGTPQQPDFAPAVSDPFGIILDDLDLFGTPVFVDLDGDGDLDILQNDYDGNIIYIENTSPPPVSQSNVDIQDLNIYPNPTADMLTVSTEADVKNVEVLDLSGRVVAAFGNQRMISLKDLAPGAYLVKLETGVGVVVKKIQVVR